MGGKSTAVRSRAAKRRNREKDLRDTTTAVKGVYNYNHLSPNASMSFSSLRLRVMPLDPQRPSLEVGSVLVVAHLGPRRHVLDIIVLRLHSLYIHKIQFKLHSNSLIGSH